MDQPYDSDPVQTLTNGDTAAPHEEVTGASLIGTRCVPAGLKKIRERASEARAYHGLDPYPLFYFRDWKTEERGPLPRCLPVARRVVNRGARWLFGRPPAVTCPANTKLEKLVTRAWKAEKLSSRLVAMAREAGTDGGIVLKFAYDESRRPQPLSIQALSVANEARLYFDPHDCQRLLMARIQYPYFDARVGKTYWYREEWTDDELVKYFPLPDESLGYGTMRADPDAFEGWRELSRETNTFGLIPAVLVKNLDTDDMYGEGSCWDLYRILDRINLTYHLMDKSNQYDSALNPVYIDLEVDDQDLNTPLAPGQGIQATSTEGEKQGKVMFPEMRGSLRPAMMEYAKDLRKQFLDAAGSVEVDQGEFSNKGNLTVAVLEQLYLPQIEMVDEQRKSWGEGGLVELFAKVGAGLQNLGVNLGVNEDDEETYTVNLAWRPYFKPSEDEKSAFVTRTQIEETAGYLPHERAIDRVAALEDIDDVPQLKDELASQPDPDPAPPQEPDLKAEETELNDMRRIGGRDSL